MTSDDCDLLRRYVEAGSDEAFEQLVGRHVGLVYSAALRRLNGDVAVNSIGRLYLGDNALGRVLVRDVNGNWYVLSEGNAGQEASLYGRYGHDREVKVAVDRQDNLYACVDYPPRVLRWTAAANAMRELK